MTNETLLEFNFFTDQDRKVIKEFATGFYYEDGAEDTAGAESTEEIIDESNDND